MAWGAGPYCLLALLDVLILAPLFAGRALYWGDVLLYFDPMLRLHQGALQQGLLPLWNPYLLGGQPFIGNPQMAVFYPTTILLPYMSASRYCSVNTIVHLFLCGAFMYLFLRRWTRRRASALAGGMVFMGSSYVVGRLQFPPMVAAIAYLPLVLCCIDRSIDQSLWPAIGDSERRRGVILSLLGVAVSVSLAVLAAHPQMAYLMLCIASLYMLTRLYHQMADKGTVALLSRPCLVQLLRGAMPIGLAIGLGLALASVQLAPCVELLTQSPREQLSAMQANRFMLLPQQLLTLLVPRFFGHPSSADYWGGGNAWETGLFVGWAPLFLVGIALRRRWQEPFVRFWALLACVGLWLAFGVWGGAFFVAFYVAPGLSNFHDPARFLLLPTLSLAVLTGVGLDRLLLSSRRAFYWAPLLLVLIGLPLWWYDRDWNPTIPDRTLEGVATARHGDALSGRSYLPRHETYWRRFVSEGYSDYGMEDVQGVATLASAEMPNLNMRMHYRSASGYEPVPVAGPTMLEGLVKSADRRGEPNLAGLMSLMDGESLVLPEGEDVHASGLRRQRTSASLWTNTRCPGTAWVVPQTRRIDGKLRVAAALAAPGFDPRTVAIVSGETHSLATDRVAPAEGESPRSRCGEVSVSGHSFTDYHIATLVGTDTALLVVSAVAYPGWKASVDGRAERIVRTDGALIGVIVPRGRHKVRVVYQPDTYRVGAYLSLVASLLVSVGASFALSSRRGGGR